MPTSSATSGYRGETAVRTRWLDALCILGLAAMTALLFASSPHDGDFWWSDAPRHAMDGVFLHDLMKDLPLGELRQYAMDYYVQYPALTLLFYPPGFAVAEAMVFAFAGVSHGTAMLAIALFDFAAALGAYAYLRSYTAPAFAFAAAGLFLGLPEVALWGRQVMLELPTCAFLLWMAWCLRRLEQSARVRYLYAFALLLAGAVYTKQTAIFIAAAMIAAVWLRKGIAGLNKRHIAAAAALTAAALAPLAITTWRFGHVNMNSVVGGKWTPAPLFSFESLTFYILQLPGQVSWPVLLLAAGYLAYSAVRKDGRRPDHLFLVLWLVLGYVFFTMIALKEPRHTVIILFPLAVFAIEAVRRLTPRRLAAALAVLVSAGVFAHTAFARSVPYVSGYREAAQAIIDRAAPGSVILFSGERDGSFIFNMRANGAGKRLTVLRADKLLLQVTQRRELGVVDRGYTAKQIAAMLNQYGVSYAVADPHFWDDLPSMRALGNALNEHFEAIAAVPIRSNVPHGDHELRIYKNPVPVAVRPAQIRLDLPIINASIEGKLSR